MIGSEGKWEGGVSARVVSIWVGGGEWAGGCLTWGLGVVGFNRSGWGDRGWAWSKEG